MTPYKNVNGDSNVVSYDTSDTSIRVVFRTGTHKNYLYDSARPGPQALQEMKRLAVQGWGLNSYISRVVKKNYARKW